MEIVVVHIDIPALMKNMELRLYNYIKIYFPFFWLHSKWRISDSNFCNFCQFHLLVTTEANIHTWFCWVFLQEGMVYFQRHQKDLCAHYGFSKNFDSKMSKNSNFCSFELQLLEKPFNAHEFFLLFSKHSLVLV